MTRSKLSCAAAFLASVVLVIGFSHLAAGDSKPGRKPADLKKRLEEMTTPAPDREILEGTVKSISGPDGVSYVYVTMDLAGGGHSTFVISLEQMPGKIIFDIINRAAGTKARLKVTVDNQFATFVTAHY